MKTIEITCPHCRGSFDLKSAMSTTAWSKFHAAMIRDETAQLRETIHQEVLEQQRLKEAEKDALLGGLRTTIELLQRKASQASQKIQGDVMEVDVAATLRQAFPFDQIQRTGNGKHGADVQHSVHDPRMGDCGLILIEVKNTATWSDRWVEKLNDDAVGVKALLAVIVTKALPKEIETFGLVDGVWVVSHKLIVPLMAALRAQLIACGRLGMKAPFVDRDGVISFITGPEFAQRVQAIVNAVVEMRSQVEREKQAMNKQWAAREKMLSALSGNVTGLCGELEAITTCKLLLDSPLESEPTANAEAA
jgi:hypothetical protein